MSVPILVTDAEQRSALAAVRSLGAAGYTVHVCSDRTAPLAGASRFARSTSVVPDALSDAIGFSEAVVALSRRLEARVVVPMTDASALALLPVRHELAPAILPLPDAPIFEAVADKAALLATAARLGLDVPRQVECADRDSRVSIEREGLRYPIVLKPTRSVAGANGLRRKLGVRHIPDERALDQALIELVDEAFPCLLQERIVGPGLGIFLLLWDGSVLARFAHRRLREKPPTGGVSVRAESVALDPEMERQAEVLLRHYGWQGVAMVEFKHDIATGRNCLMEVNGRFWGSLQLAIDSGVNFPALLVSAAAGMPVEPVRTYRTGVCTRWWWGEVDHFVTRLRRSSHALGLAPEPPPPSLVRVALDILSAPLRGVRGEVLRLADPAPGLRETLQWVLRR